MKFSPHDLFVRQKCTAHFRGIKWKLSFEEWWGIWEGSGHFAERGRGKGKYQMARLGDKGPYAVGNVQIVTHERNVIDALHERKFSKKQRLAISKRVIAYWHNLTPSERKKHGQSVGEANRMSGKLKEICNHPDFRAMRSRDSIAAWARKTKAEKLEFGRLVREGRWRPKKKRRAHDNKL